MGGVSLEELLAQRAAIFQEMATASETLERCRGALVFCTHLINELQGQQVQGVEHVPNPGEKAE